MSYADRLKKRLEVTGSALCVGLDPRPDSTEGGVDGIAEFLRRVVGETAEYAAAFKPNAAFFEAQSRCPQLVEREPSLVQFLQYERYNVWAAAERVAEYMSSDDLKKKISNIRKEMEKAAKDLNFIEVLAF